MAQFEYSEYQKNIIHDALYGSWNMLIQARAGAAKTSTIVEIIKQLPHDVSKLYCAFNKEIVSDIENKTKDIANIKISTIHSLGYEIIRHNNKDIDIQVNDDKYRQYVNTYIHEYSTECYPNLNYNKKYKFRTNVLNIIKYARINLLYGKKQIEQMCIDRRIMLICDEIDCALKIMKWGENNIEEIDYGDMIWLPNVKAYRFPSFDYIFLDEAQDISIAQREMILKCYNMKTKYIMALDENQLIYSFAGADINSLNALKHIKNTKIYKLPINYRCPKLVVNMAKPYVEDLVAYEHSCLGVVNYHGKISDIKPNDMVLCRNNAPLLKLKMYLIEHGIECYIKGNENIQRLKDLVLETNKNELSSNLEKDGVFPQLYNGLFTLMEYLKTVECCDDAQILNNPILRLRKDDIDVLDTLAQNCNNVNDLLNQIDNAFTDDEKNGVILSTIHKAKGLECDNVHILCYNDLQTQISRLYNENDKQQEKNLLYVALTRPKKELSIINDEEYSKYSNNLTLEEISSKKYQIYDVLKISKTDINLTKEYAKEIVKHFTEIELPSKPNNIVVLEHVKNDKPEPRSIALSLKDKMNKLKFKK